MIDKIKIQPYIDLEVPEYFEDKREVDVIVHLSVSKDGKIWFGPMKCSATIHKNKNLAQVRHELIENYESQGFEFVTVDKVFIDKDFAQEYTAYWKEKNSNESKRFSKFIHKMIEHFEKET